MTLETIKGQAKSEIEKIMNTIIGNVEKRKVKTGPAEAVNFPHYALEEHRARANEIKRMYGENILDFGDYENQMKDKLKGLQN